MQLVAAWAYKRKWSVLASHIPGERNVWADQLSRGNTSAFDSKPRARFRFRPHDFWPHKPMLSLHPPERGADGERTRIVFLPAPPNLDFQATPYKGKEHAHLLSVVLSYLLLHVPFRIEAVIKILTFRVFLFPYVLILLESSDALPFPASSHLRVMREGSTPLFFAPTHPPSYHSGGSSRAQPQLAPQRYCAQHAPACSDRFDRSQPCTVCRIAHQPDARIASCRHQCLRLFHASQVTHLAPGRTRFVDHGGI